MGKIKDLIYILLIVFVMIAIVPKVFQNDTFFTIAIGENTLKNGLTDQEVLTYHEDLKFPHSGVFDVLVTLIYNKFGFFGIYFGVILISICQGILYYYILLKMTKSSTFSFFMTIISMYFLRIAFSARAQLISNFLLLLEFYCLENIKNQEKIKRRYIALLLVMPIIYANIHSSTFPVYLILYLPYIVEYLLNKIPIMKEDSRFIYDVKNIKVLLILFVVSVISGGLTNTGLTPYTDMIKVTKGMSFDFIAELQPLTIFDNMYLTAIMILTISILIFSKQKIRVSDSLFILGFSLLAMSNRRSMYYFILVSSLCFFRILTEFLDMYEFKLDFIPNVIKRVSVLCIISIIFFKSVNMFLLNIPKEYEAYENYPVLATNYILNNINLDKMRIYNHFNFGSYLEFRGIKTFIDSRSGVFTEEFNPGCTVLKDWKEVSNLTQNYNDVFDKYKITHALLYVDEPIAKLIRNDSKWKYIYQDSTFILYERVEEI